MSAFIVEDRTINGVITFFALEKSDSWYKRKLKELNPQFDLDTREGREALGKAMFWLNVQAVTYRYEGGAEDFRALNYKYQDYPYFSPIQALKSLRCWLYQCAEGNIPETSKLYQLMEEFSHRLALDIVRKTKEYENAYWG